MLNAIQCGACRGHYRRQSLLVSLQPSALATICFAQSCLAKEGWQTWWSMSFGRCLKEVLMVPSLSATFLGFQACMLYLQGSCGSGVSPASEVNRSLIELLMVLEMKSYLI
ncbi:hypothetical protein MUK42_35213 [Musa troglodytarum]|uniref:Uncharacterized protein n=1 Tax=Musa troglodytarum TaxID=320322 RepID=A0A9E7GFP2_9LILI|nr:hypothetical protein MUK42_35213 [Musa troglodytarum]